MQSTQALPSIELNRRSFLKRSGSLVIAFSLMAQARLRFPATLMAVSGIVIAWARIYLGVHFPLDMVGAAVVAALCAWLVRALAGWYLEPLYRLTRSIYHMLFGWLIRKGLIRP